jgi:hypothetical protein
MTENSGFKRQIRARMAITGEPYSVARRAIEKQENIVSRRELEQVIADIRAYLADKGRWLVPHGFTVQSVKDNTAVMRMPVIWEPEKGVLRARASDQPSSANVDELRSLFERGLSAGQFAPGARVARWDAVIDDGPRPSNIDWTVRVRVGA